LVYSLKAIYFIGEGRGRVRLLLEVIPGRILGNGSGVSIAIVGLSRRWKRLLWIG
jgi:hypothetical protein